MTKYKFGNYYYYLLVVQREFPTIYVDLSLSNHNSKHSTENDKIYRHRHNEHSMTFSCVVHLHWSKVRIATFTPKIHHDVHSMMNDTRKYIAAIEDYRISLLELYCSINQSAAAIIFHIFFVFIFGWVNIKFGALDETNSASTDIPIPFDGIRNSIQFPFSSTVYTV